MDKNLLTYILLLLSGIFFWKKYDHPRYKFLPLPFVTLIVLWIYEKLSLSYLALGSTARTIEDLIVFGLGILSIVAFGYILFTKRWDK